MDVASWQQRWQQGRIGFHLADVNPLLIKYCHRLCLQPGDKVLVPLCGKSRDMHWLHGQGYTVTGVELSPIAAKAFFKENNLHACDLEDGRFTIWRHAELEIHCGDIFEFSNEGSDAIAACYDRAALIALPETRRSAYVQHLMRLLPAGSRTLLITLEYKRDEMQGPPFSVSRSEVQGLYGKAFDVELLETLDALQSSPHLRERGATQLTESVYLLTRR